MPTMQDVIQQLHAFWLSQGCILGQPYNSEVGAGTLNPATSLRVLGPEKWSVAYVEPSVRPDDSRYGLNPNRLQTHTQYQVILKPTPDNPQEVFLASLEAIGIDLSKHDVRFVEDNWASPALGAWGLGWEVWLDGLEITQFTYFQQSGTHELNPVPVEITYGLERIVMALQGVKHFTEIEYAPGVKYGDFVLEVEAEMSAFYLDTADTDSQRQLFDLYEAEAKRQLEKGLAIPAHYHLLKMSHAFNILDARGAVGTAQRALAFTRMRDLARDISSQWIETVAERGHPLGVAPEPQLASVTEPQYSLDAPAPLAIEIGTEELPPHEVERCSALLESALVAALDDERIEHGDVHTYASPRRLIVVIDDVAGQQTSLDMTITGPKVSQAFDAEGNPGPAALGFARKHGIDPSELQRVQNGDELHVGVELHEDGKAASEVLADALPKALKKLAAGKNMRWGAPDLEFSRPIRYVLALHGDHVVPFAYSDLAAGRTTRVHRNDESPERSINSADELLDTLRSAGIEPDASVRRRAIETKTQELVADIGSVDFGLPVVAEVVNLVEDPTPILCRFEQSFLDLPPEILRGVMIKHQRYLPVLDPKGQLTDRFIAVANGHIDVETVRRGNENVIAARYADAKFFWDADLKTPLQEMAKRLDAVTFQDTLGSVADHVRRAASIADAVASDARLDKATVTAVQRAGQLLKFDMGSQMVTEMTSLSGLMAREYALRAGESPVVANALQEAETAAPAKGSGAVSLVGSVLAASERADTLVGLFAAGAKPTGSKDPFGLRRAAGGVVDVLMSPAAPNVSVKDLLTKAASQQPIPVEPATLASITAFINRRMEQSLVDAGFAKEQVRSVMPLADRPQEAHSRLVQLSRLSGTDAFLTSMAALKRVSNIVPFGTETGSINSSLLTEPAEIGLAEALKSVAGSPPKDLVTFVAAFQVLQDPVNRFLDGVTVNAGDPAVQANRKALLSEVRRLGDGLIDWSALPQEASGTPVREVENVRPAAQRFRPGTITMSI